MLQECWMICGALTRYARSLSSGSPLPCFLAGRDLSVEGTCNGPGSILMVHLGMERRKGCVDIRERGVDAGSMTVSLAARRAIIRSPRS